MNDPDIPISPNVHELPIRVCRAILRYTDGDVATMRDISKYTRTEFSAIPGMGARALYDITHALQRCGLDWKKEATE